MSSKVSGKVYGAVTVGERGQIVIPANIRKSFNIHSGDKMIVMAKPNGMIGLIRTEEFSQFLDQATEMLAKLNK